MLLLDHLELAGLAGIHERLIIIYPKWQVVKIRNRDAARHGEVGFLGGSRRREMEMQMEGKFDEV
jgi:hypothetical protein